ncbi:MAG: hypothetical protein F4201_06225 [Nitrospira sp. SB0677_bin_15]|nr:hypothetical protein [Nitrospira sp. SB0677_bin_15]
MAVKRSMPLWGKVVWGLGVLASLSLVLWMLLPSVVSHFVERQFEAFGCKHVNVEIERPGLRRTVVPLVSFQKAFGTETAHLTIRGLTLDYELARLREGFLNEARIEELHLDLRGGPGAQSEPAPGEPSLSTVAATLDSVSEFLLNPRVERFAWTNASIFREQATGPFRRLKVSGTLRHEKETLTGSITFQGTKGKPYALQLTMNPHGRTKVLLHSGKGSAESLLDIESTVQVSQALHWQGSLKTNLKRAAPFMALLLPFGPDLERVDGVVQFQGEGSTKRIESFDRLLRDASTRVHGAFQASAQLPAWGENSEDIAVTLSGEVDADATGAALTLFPSSSAKVLVHPPADLLKKTSFLMPLREKAPVHLQLEDTVKARVSLGDDPSWYLDGPIRVQYGAKSAPIGIDVVVTSASGPFRDPLSTKADVHGRLWGALPVLESEPVHAKDLRWNVMGKLAFQEPAIHVEVEKGSWVKTGPLRFEQGTADLAEFYVSRALPVSVEMPSKKWEMGPTTAQVRLSPIHWGGRTITMERVGLRLQEASGQGKQWQTTGTAHVRRPQLDGEGRTVTMERVGVHVQEAWGNGNEWQATGTAKILGLSSELDEFVPPKVNLAMKFDVAPALVKAGILAETVDQSVKATGRVTHDASTNQGSLRATLAPRPFSPSGTTLSRLITPWEHPFDVTGGRLALSAAVTWGAGPRRVPAGSDNRRMPGGVMVKQGQVVIMTKDLDGYYEDVPVEDVNTTITVNATGPDDVTMAGPATVRIGRVAPGVALENIALTLRLGRLGFGDSAGQPSVDLRDVSAHTLGGRVSSPRIHIDPAQPSTRFTLNVDGVQLDRLLQLEQQQGLEGSGVLDGSIPITLNGKTVTIHEGLVAVRPPGGVIRFAPLDETRQMLVRAKPEMELVLRALENFRYDVLRALVSYQEDGTLLLETRLEGKNPDMKEAPPVHFNLNVQENVPALLQSVQVVKDIENQLEKAFGQP